MSAALHVLHIAVLLACAGALGLLVYAVLTTPSMPAERLGLRGYKRTQALRQGGGFGTVEPLMRWLSTRLGGLLSPALRRHLDHQITLAGDALGLQAEDLVSLSILASALTTGLGVAYTQATERGPFLVLIGFCVGAFLPYYQLLSTAQARVRSIQQALPSVVDLMVLGLGAGLDFTASVRQVIDHASRADEPLVEELRLLLQELKLGRTRRQALAQFAERAPCEAVRDLVAATMQSEEQGTPLASVIAAQATSSRQRRSVNAEEAAAKAGTKLMLPLFLLFGATLMLIVAPTLITLSRNF
ncbi:MAG: type II secretion system F family protein [Polyangiales bacterium]